MSKQLGIGVRVWCNWCPSETVNGDIDPRLKVGVIIGGPFPPGKNIFGYVFRETGWRVLIDGGDFAARESLLTPIDDDEESVTELAEVDSKITEGESS